MGALVRKVLSNVSTRETGVGKVITRRSKDWVKLWDGKMELLKRERLLPERVLDNGTI